MSQMDQQSYRKKIQYLIARRATLELENLLGDFWRNHGNAVTDAELPDLERILVMEDLDLLEIILGKRPVPTGYNPKLMRLITEARPARGHFE